MKHLFLVLVLIAVLNYSGKSDNGSIDLVKNYSHAIYISVVEIEHKDLDNNAKIMIKIFTDDFKDAILNAFEKQIDFSDEKSCSDNKSVIEGYFNKHFKAAINGKHLSISLTSCELNGDSVWLYFDMNCPTYWKEISVTADFLMELFPKQSNIVSIYHGNDKRFLRLTINSITQKVTF